MEETIKVMIASALMYFALQTVASSRGIGALLLQLTIGSLVYLTSIVALDVLQSRHWLVPHFTGWLPQRGPLSGSPAGPSFHSPPRTPAFPPPPLPPLP